VWTSVSSPVGGPCEGAARALADLALLDVGCVAGAGHLRIVSSPLAQLTMNSWLAAADGAGFRLDCGVIEAAAGEDVGVRAVHGVVGVVEAAGAFDVRVEGVRVLHDELAAAEQTGTGAGLVAELGLDLVEIERERL
jgi:hypothetical protein